MSNILYWIHDGDEVDLLRNSNARDMHQIQNENHWAIKAIC